MRISDFLGSFLVVLGVVVTVIGVRLIFNFVMKRTSKSSFPYHRQLITFAVVLLGLFLAIALLPIAHEVKGQILSVLGVLLSAVIALSSTTLVGNAMAGIMLRMMHEFRAGDFIEIDDMIGRVTDFGIFHTEMQMITRDVVSLPNLLLVQRPVKVTRRGGTFIHVDVSIGYTVPHTTVEAALKEAAESISLSDPFVFVQQLFDHAIQYRIYGLLEEFSERLSKTSDLHKAVLSVLHAQKIEIASPSVMDRREFPTDHVYIPKKAQEEPAVEAPVQAIEEMAFDKAEDAESLEQLKREEQKLLKSLEDSEAGTAGKKKNGSKSSKERIKAQVERIQQEITKREEEIESQKEKEG
jgi:small-conductance mechanosensitive channel